MKIAVTTPTGHIGSKVAELLLDARAELILLTRDGAKVDPFARRGAKVYEGSLDDPEYVTRATRNVDALFWVTPPNPTARNFRKFQRDCGWTAAQAVFENGISHIVNLSSIGAQLKAGTGPIAGLHEVETTLEEVSRNITHLRPGFFFENFLWQIDSIRRNGCISLPVSGRRKMPMIATRDIARVAAERLLDPYWTGLSILGLHGPEDLTLEEATEEISRGIDFRLRYVKAPETLVREGMKQMGMSDNVVETMLEMYRAADSGLLVPAERRTPETTTPTPLEEFAREVLAPMVMPAGVGV